MTHVEDEAIAMVSQLGQEDLLRRVDCSGLCDGVAWCDDGGVSRPKSRKRSRLVVLVGALLVSVRVHATLWFGVVAVIGYQVSV